MADHTSHKLWIGNAIKHPGALTAKAHAAGDTLAEFENEPHENPKIRREVALAKTLKKMHHGK